MSALFGLLLACAGSPHLEARDLRPVPSASSGVAPSSAPAADTAIPGDTAAPADPGACFVASWGVDGACLPTADCAALGDHTSVPGYCPGDADIQCCTDTPDVADNPAVPAGWHLMAQADVTAEMTDFAVEILDDGTLYPMFSTTVRAFDGGDVLARVEWHPPDFQNDAVHRGVTLYQPD